MEAIHNRSAMQVVAAALGWEIVKDFGQDFSMSVHHMGSVVVFKTPDGTTKIGFHGFTEDERNGQADEVLMKSCIAAAFENDPDGGLHVAEWRLPPISSPDDASIRIALGQHLNWKRQRPC